MLHDYFNFENDLGYILIQDPTIIQDSRVYAISPNVISFNIIFFQLHVIHIRNLSIATQRYKLSNAFKSCIVNTSNHSSDVDLFYGSAEVLTRLKKVFGTTTPKEGRQDFLVVQSPKIWSCGGGLLRRPRVASSISVLVRPQERPSFLPLLLLDNGDMHIDYEVNFKSLFLNECMV